MKVVYCSEIQGREEEAGGESGLLNEGITREEVEQTYKLDNLNWKAAPGIDGLTAEMIHSKAGGWRKEFGG